MSAYITVNGSMYSDLLSLSFAPEYDPTLATLPICEFEAKIITDDPAKDFDGQSADLYEIRFITPKLMAGAYTISEAEQINENVVRIRAQSLLALLDKRVLAAGMFSFIQTDVFIKRLFTDPTVNDYDYIPVWDDDAPFIKVLNAYYSYSVYGVCQKHTARERLRLYCQAFGNYIQQWGNNSEYGLAIAHKNISALTVTKVILPENTFYMQPARRDSSIGTLTINRYANFTSNYHKESDGWEKYVIQEGWTDPNTGLTFEEQAYYYQKSSTSKYVYNGADQNCFDAVEIADNLLTYYDYLFHDIQKTTHFSHYIVELDVLCDGYKNGDTYYERNYFPGDDVAFFAKDGTMYYGIVKSADYTFGTLARAKLTILTDMKPVSPAYVDVNYRYNNGGYHIFGSCRYNIPPGEEVYITPPQYTIAYIDGVPKRLLRSSSSSKRLYNASAGTSVTVTDDYTIIN